MRKYLLLRRGADVEDDDDEDDIEVHHHTHHHHHHPMDSSHSESVARHHHDGSTARYAHHTGEHSAAYEAVMERLVDCPTTWEAYKKDGDYLGIVKMEHSELAAAKASGSQHAIKKELEDLCAACIYALSKM